MNACMHACMNECTGRLRHHREEILSVANASAAAAAAKDGMADVASAVGDVAVELVAMMRRAGAAQRDKMQRKKAKEMLKALQKQYTKLVAAKVSS